MEDDMKIATLSGALLILFLGMPLAAQEARFGISADLAFPMGGFSSTDYPADGNGNPAANNSFNAGVGVKFLAYLPVQKNLAVRLSAGFQTFDGSSTSPGYASMNLSDQMFSLGAEGQFFLGGGSAYRQSGTYILAGAAMDFERFDASYGNPGYDASQTINTNRVAGLIGIGHTFRGHWGRQYLLEASYHKTLTQCDVSAGNQPGSDFLAFSFGVVM